MLGGIVVTSTILTSIALPVIILSTRPRSYKRILRVLLYDFCLFAIAQLIEMFYFLDISLIPFLQKFLLLNLPLFTIVFGYTTTVYKIFPIIFIAAIDNSIIFSIERPSFVPVALAIYFYIFSFSIFAFLIFGKISPLIILEAEINAKYHKYLNACITFLCGYAFIMYQRKNGNFDIRDSGLLLTLFAGALLSIIVLEFIVPLDACLIDEKHKKMAHVMAKKIIIIYLIVFILVINIKRGNKAVFESMVCFLPITVFAQLLYAKIKIGLKLSTIFFTTGRFKIDGDKFKINLINKTAKLYRKGNEINLIKSHIIFEDTKFDVVSFHRDFLKKYNLNSIIVLNEQHIPVMNRIKDKRVTIKCFQPDGHIEMHLSGTPDVKPIELVNGNKNIININEKLYCKKKLELLLCPKVSHRLSIRETCSSINSSACCYCQFIQRITFPPSVVRIGDYAFAYCGRLNTIRFSQDSRLKSIGSYSFFCTQLVVVVFPNLLESIGDSAFKWCNSLRRAVLPKNQRLMYRISDSFDSNPDLKIDFKNNHMKHY